MPGTALKINHRQGITLPGEHPVIAYLQPYRNGNSKGKAGQGLPHADPRVKCHVLARVTLAKVGHMINRQWGWVLLGIELNLCHGINDRLWL
jgi:hypothetical protein